MSGIKRKIKKEGIVTMLVKSYMLFTLLIVAIISCTYLFAIWRSANHYEDEFLDVKKYERLLKEGRYKDIPVKKLLGKDSFIQVADSNGKVIFTRDATNKTGEIAKRKAFTKKELRSIVNFDEFVLVKESGRDISISIYNSNDTRKYKEIIILSPDKKILYSTTKNFKGSIGEEEFEFLNSYKAYKHTVKKLAFKDEHGNINYLIMFSKSNRLNQIARILLNIKEALAMFLIFYLFMLLLFVVWLKRKISRPVKVLERGLKQLTKESKFHPIEYHGVRELEDICENFNTVGKEIYRANEVKAQRLADISHDLKTPMTVLQGYSNAISDGLVREEDIPKYLKLISQKSNVVVELIDCFHTYSLMERGEFKLNLEKIEICEFVREYFAGKYQEIQLEGYDLDADITDEKIYILGDKLQLRRAFENIVSNTIKYNTPGTIFKIAVRPYGTAVEILLGDDGIGMNEEIAKRIFEPFYIGDAARSVPSSSGLGMSIVKGIINRHGGTIKIKTPPEKGFSTEFVIYIKQYLGE